MTQFMILNNEDETKQLCSVNRLIWQFRFDRNQFSTDSLKANDYNQNFSKYGKNQKFDKKLFYNKKDDKYWC